MQATETTTNLYTFERGNKFFELTNHLGNVLVTITDKKIPVPTSSTDISIAYWSADITTASDYYPFGMQMPGRNGKTVAGGGGWSRASARDFGCLCTRAACTGAKYEEILFCLIVAKATRHRRCGSSKDRSEFDAD